LPGVYTFRDLSDAQKLLARRLRSRRTVVLGGGLLGLEAARAMRRFHTDITVVEHAPRLMPRQLDEAAAGRLRGQVEACGIHVITGDGVTGILGEGAVRAVRLRSGRTLDCDTVVIATGIVPNVRLALDAGLPIQRGIRVDDTLRTADPDVYAVGECAEHRGVVYGLVAPCLEQAAVAAAGIAGTPAQYRGSIAVTRLKVFKTPVFGAGVHPDEVAAGACRKFIFSTPDRRCYRTLLTRHGRLVGALGIGDWDELPRVLESVQHGRRLGFWQGLRFRRRGHLWSPEGGSSVAYWPAQATVCNCTGVTRGQLTDAIAAGCATPRALAARTRASTVCGSCGPLLSELFGRRVPAPPTSGWRALLVCAGLALIAAAGVAVLPDIPYVASWSATELRWDQWWRESFLKQLSGYSLLGLAALSLVLSLRKRLPKFSLGGYPGWRFFHVGLGLAAVAVLLLHTGGRLGHGLNTFLMSTFVAVVAAGALAGTAVALEHRLAAASAKRLRQTLLWTHVLTFWPLPALLTFHVLKTYYF
ncbi:MAG: FAD-dependent oxidoreductase, partial [Nevskiales bacterium]|nr:FAD-dependent oxidoreductase [Nevskiales bacterium]